MARRKIHTHTWRVAKSEWDEDLVRRVGAEVKKRRAGRSAQWLSDRTAELGRRVPTTVIAKLDSGHRGSVLHVSEVLVLAAALGVPPLQLIYPDLPDAEVEVWPGEIKRSFEAAQWFSGEDLPADDADIALARSFYEVRDRLERAHLGLTVARGMNDAGQIESAELAVAHLVNEVAAQAVRLINTGHPVYLGRLGLEVRKRIEEMQSKGQK